MSDADTDLITSKRMRENCMRFLSACFYEPEKEMFIEENLFGNLETCLTACGNPAAAAAAAQMAELIKSCSSDDLRVEHARLFVGPYELVAAPYGSVYLDGGKRVMGDSTMEVIKTYEQEGLIRDEDCKDLPDHIAVELEFVSFLLCKELEALEKSDTDAATAYAAKQQAFLQTSVQTWVPDFCENIRGGTDSEFYTALADCLFATVMR